MKIQYHQYNIADTINRLDTILGENPLRYGYIHNIPVEEERAKIPMSIMHASVLVVDIDIKSPTEVSDDILTLKMDKLAKSEICNVMCDYANCIDIVLGKNSVMGIYNTPIITDVDFALDTAAKISTLSALFEKLFTQRSIDYQVNLRIGLCYGNVYYFQIDVAGEKVVNWAGPVIDEAFNCSTSIEPRNSAIRIDNAIYNNLKKKYQEFFSKDDAYPFYYASLINTGMKEWINSK